MNKIWANFEQNILKLYEHIEILNEFQENIVEILKKNWGSIKEVWSEVNLGKLREINLNFASKILRNFL